MWAVRVDNFGGLECIFIGMGLVSANFLAAVLLARARPGVGPYSGEQPIVPSGVFALHELSVLWQLDGRRPLLINVADLSRTSVPVLSQSQRRSFDFAAKVRRIQEFVLFGRVLACTRGFKVAAKSWLSPGFLPTALTRTPDGSFSFNRVELTPRVRNTSECAYLGRAQPAGSPDHPSACFATQSISFLCGRHVTCRSLDFLLDLSQTLVHYSLRIPVIPYACIGMKCCCPMKLHA
jgi:hypothetical protein